MADAQKTPIEPGMILMSSGLLVPQGGSAFFGPGESLPPVAAPEQLATVVGRQFDYPFATNTRSQPRADDDVSFSQLRALASGCDILRLVIQTRKYQMGALEWSIAPAEENKKIDERCHEVQEFLQCPDGENNWHEWMQMLLEDRFVIDAVTIYPWLRNNGKPYRFELMDGAQIARVLDARGRTPAPPAPAYRHVIKGMAATYYTADELIYAPANKRTSKQYGYSEVEQIVMTVNMALREQISKMQRFTDGSTPDLLFQTPQDWQMAQIKEFNDWWQERLSGNTSQQRKAQFVPHGVVPIDTKETVLKNEFDEWLARVVCYAFSVSPQAFVKQLNRSTAETAQAMAKEEGLFPVMNWIRGLMDRVIAKYFGYADLRFKWKVANELSEKEQWALDDQALKNGSIMLDEVRIKRGQKPYGINFPMVLTGSGYVPVPKTEEEAKAINAPPPVAPADVALADGGKGKPQPPAMGNKDEEEPSKKLAKMNAPQPGLELEVIRSMFLAKFKKLAGSIEAQLEDGEDADSIELEFGDLAENLYRSILKEVRAGVKIGEEAIEEAGHDLVEAAVTDAKAWASERVGDLIGKVKNGKGEWVDNAKPGMSIADSTREMIRADIAEGLEQGRSNQEIAKGLQESYAFSPERAELIARTETGAAQTQGAIEAYKANGVDGMRFAAAPDCCDECQEQDGEIIVFGEAEEEGLPHPQCRCAWQPWWREE